jgi:hypothetical protein
MGIPQDEHSFYRFDDVPAVVKLNLHTTVAEIDDKRSDSLYGMPTPVCTGGHVFTGGHTLKNDDECPHCQGTVKIVRITERLLGLYSVRKVVAERFQPTLDLLDQIVGDFEDKPALVLETGSWVKLGRGGEFTGLITYDENGLYRVEYDDRCAGVFQPCELTPIGPPPFESDHMIGEQVVVPSSPWKAEGKVVGTHPDGRIGVLAFTTAHGRLAGLFAPSDVISWHEMNDV